MEFPFYREDFERTDFVEQIVPQVESVDALHELLSDPRLLAEVRAGNVTLAMIRPGLEEATTIDGNDADVAFDLESNVQRLGVMAKFSIKFDKTAFEEFYAGGPREAQLAKPPEKHMEFPNRWEEFASLMTSGTTTILLLHSPEGNAIELWREQVGHWNLEANRDPETIRGQFGLNNYNNLVHGSDAPESVERELQIVDRLISRNYESDS